MSAPELNPTTEVRVPVVGEYRSRWGWHPCSYEDFLQVKALHKAYWETVKTLADHRRWVRKWPKNRIIRTYARDEQGRRCGITSTRPRPEPTVCWELVRPQNTVSTHAFGQLGDLIIGSYRDARTPKPSPQQPWPADKLQTLAGHLKIFTEWKEKQDDRNHGNADAAQQ